MIDLSQPDRRPVLVVEDCDDDFDTIAAVAGSRKPASRLLRASRADSALDLLDAHGAVGFAFMLLDFNLPGLDGLGLLREMRANKALRSLPVVVFSTSVNARDRDAFYEAGANAYHVKTVSYQDCLRVLGCIFDYWLNQSTLPGLTLASASGLRSA